MLLIIRRPKFLKYSTFLEVKGIINRCSPRISSVFCHINYRYQIITVLREESPQRSCSKVNMAKSLQKSVPCGPSYFFQVVVHSLLPLNIHHSKTWRADILSLFQLICLLPPPLCLQPAPTPSPPLLQLGLLEVLHSFLFKCGLSPLPYKECSTFQFWHLSECVP